MRVPLNIKFTAALGSLALALELPPSANRAEITEAINELAAGAVDAITTAAWVADTRQTAAAVA